MKMCREAKSLLNKGSTAEPGGVKFQVMSINNTPKPRYEGMLFGTILNRGDF